MKKILWTGKTVLKPFSERYEKLIAMYGPFSSLSPYSRCGFISFNEATIEILLTHNVEVIATDVDVPEDWYTLFSNPQLRKITIIKWDGEKWEEFNPDI